jgi:hypothetical protein
LTPCQSPLVEKAHGRSSSAEFARPVHASLHGRLGTEAGRDRGGAFADDGARGEGLSLEDEDGSLLVATGEGFGPYTLEHFPSERSGTHLRACDEFKKGEVQAAMLDDLRGGTAWRESYSWREVEDEKGGLVAALTALSAAAPWVLIAVGVTGVSHASSRVLFLK